MERKPKSDKEVFEVFEEEEVEEEEDESSEEDEEEEEDGLPPIKLKKKLKRKKPEESEVRYFPKAVSNEEMLNENYIASQENITLGKEILLKLDKVLNSIE